MAPRLTWLIFGEAVLGTVEATSHRAAVHQAVRRFGERVRRVQSRTSVRTAELELTPELRGLFYGAEPPYRVMLVQSDPRPAPRPSDRWP